MWFRKNYLMGNTIKGTPEYSQCSSNPVSIQRHISTAPYGLCIPAGLFAATGRPIFSSSEGEDLHPPRFQQAHLLLWFLTCNYFRNEINQHGLCGSLKQPAANQWQMLECETRILEPHPVQTVLLPRARTQSAAGVADWHRRKQAGNGFAVTDGTKALAAVAIESEGWKGYTHQQTTACTSGWWLQQQAARIVRFYHAVVFFTV